jgi:GNAT superfamily N-acetyltransferase
MTNTAPEIRRAEASEYTAIGELLVTVYSQLDGFPKESEQPDYYRMLANVGELAKRPHAEILVAIVESRMVGAVVFFGDMQFYGSATNERDAAGFRLLAVLDEARGQGIGKQLTQACIDKATQTNRSQLIIHTTEAMKKAWNMYERMGFKRSEDLDFMQGKLAVYGFRMWLKNK